jgi:hypothetical protein
MTPKILYCALHHLTTERINHRYPREIIRAVQLDNLTGHRGDIIVVEPLPNAGRYYSELEREQYWKMVDHAQEKCPVGVPLIIGYVR